MSEPIRYLDVCSGYSAPTVAWQGLGFEAAGYSEIEAFPRAVLEQRHGAVPVDWNHRHIPGEAMVPLFGDFTNIEEHHVGSVQLLVGGTPCQAFSVAGKRAGLDDPRGNLTLEYLALARRLRPEWLVWENVPGVLSDDKGRTMGTFLGLLGELGYGWAYRVLDAQYVRVGMFGRAVPQRRRRVFVVACARGASRAAAVLFERASLRGDPAPSRLSGEGVAPTLAARTRGGGGLGTDTDLNGGLIANTITAGTARRRGSGQLDNGNLIGLPDVSHTLRGEGFDASPNADGGDTILAFQQNQLGEVRTGEVFGTLNTNSNASGRNTPMVAHGVDLYNASLTGDVSVTVKTGGGCADSPGAMTETHAIQAGAEVQCVHHDYAVRRLTPRECERLQGLPDDFTLITYRGKPASDSVRYKAIGNSMACNVMRFIGERIAFINGLDQ